MSAIGPDTGRDVARRHLARTFRALGIGSADLDARLLLCAACGIDHGELIRNPDEAVGAGVVVLMAMMERRVSGEPVSRIVGRREFWGHDFALTSAVLDPRPETEGLVASVLASIGPARRPHPLRLLDLGTGSGIILCSLLSELPRATGLGIDRSSEACVVARTNIRAMGLTARSLIACGDWAGAVGGEALFDIAVSNPPYIRSADIATLDLAVRGYDPHDALDGGDDGLEAFRTLVPQFGRLLKVGGIAAVECGAGQGAAVATLMVAEGFGEVRVDADLAGHDRVVIGSR